ncbi:galactokinase [Glutamicibacter endophyticus]|uniref:galactokinase n=1 Tax=Glutamicibacter endophyticus TaxID=1522174 RepID=UPI003AF0DC7E
MIRHEDHTVEQRARRLHERFEALYGHRPEGVWQAPGRVNLMGEHTDYNLGYVLPFAIDRQTLIAVRRVDPDAAHADEIALASTMGAGGGAPEVTRMRLADLAPGTPAGWAAYPAAVSHVLAAEYAGRIRGFELLVDSTVPVGSGLSSSHALEVATIVALNEVLHLGLDAERMVRLTQRAENDFVGAPTGIMDQSASLLSQAGHALFLDCRSFASRAVPLPLTERGLKVLVIDTRVAHALVDGGYAQRRASCEAAAARLGVSSLREIDEVHLLDALEEPLRRRARHIVSENGRVLHTVQALERGDLNLVGQLLTESHASMRDDYEISCPELDLAVSAALEAGALGARMTGGGFGGSAIALIDETVRPQVESAIRQAFDRAGYAEPGIFVVAPAQGAGRV